MTPELQRTNENHVAGYEDAIARMRNDFFEGLIRRKEQKVINALGQYLNMDSIPTDFLISIKDRLRCTHCIQTGDESYYIDGHHLITFKPPVITMEGNVMTAQQGYGPVGV